MTKKWTHYRLTENMLKLLAVGYGKYQRAEASTFCGGEGAFWRGASSSRRGLYNRGLIDDKHQINQDGIEAFEAARAEGW